MKTKDLWMLIVGLFLASGTLLVDRFIVAVPDLLAVAFAVAAIILITIFMLRNRTLKKQ